MFGWLTAGPKLKALIASSMQEMSRKTDAACEEWWLGSADRWDADDEAGSLTFTFPDRRVVAPIQIVGTYSVEEGTWLWSWANATIEPSLTKDAELVRAYGQRKRHSRLTTAKLTCSEYEAWEFAALACHLAGAQSVYRGPSGSLRTFMTLGSVSIHPLC